MIVRGFIEPIAKQLPLEYAVELNRLIELEMEGSRLAEATDARSADGRDGALQSGSRRRRRARTARHWLGERRSAGVATYERAAACRRAQLEEWRYTDSFDVQARRRCDSPRAAATADDSGRRRVRCSTGAMLRPR